MRSNVVIVLFTFAVFASANDYIVEECECVPLNNCPQLWSNLIAAKLKSIYEHKIYLEYLRTLTCGYQNHMPLVCCQPIVPNDDSETSLNDSADPQKSKAKWTKCVQFRPKNSTTTPPPPLSNMPQSDAPIKSKEEHPEEESSFSQCGRSLKKDNHFGNETELSDFPWLALLEYDTLDGKKFLCGGVLISDRYVLTAAHCVTSRANILKSVRLGEYDTSTSIDCVNDNDPKTKNKSKSCINSSIRIPVERTIVHEGYKDDITHRDEDDFQRDDLALVQLKEPVVFSYYVQPICLPRAEAESQKYLVAGWSRSFIPSAKGFDRKLMSKLTELEVNSCMDNGLLPFVNEQHICAGINVPGERACIADAGGPLMGYELKDNGEKRLTVFGISYMDLACDRSDLPGVFTRVYHYMPWILKHIQN